MVLGAVLGCSNGTDWLPPPGEDTDTTIVEQTPTHCGGECVTVAPATFTGPSLFWFGTPTLTPSCPAGTPHQGIEGYLDMPSPWFARECLITPSDSCEDEGETCAPPPPNDFRLCIHHPEQAECGDTDYPHRGTMFDAASAIEVTLCCQGSPVF